MCLIYLVFRQGNWIGVAKDNWQFIHARFWMDIAPRRTVILSTYTLTDKCCFNKLPSYFAKLLSKCILVPIAQLDRASDCGSEGRWFESTWVRFMGSIHTLSLER